MAVDRQELIAAAQRILGEFRLRNRFSAGSVSAALLTEKGNIYTGICVDLACGLGFCAEIAAVAEMLKARETHVVALVAVGQGAVLSAPCGRCRETIAQIDPRNLECAVIVGEDTDVALRTLLPRHWLPGE